MARGVPSKRAHDIPQPAANMYVHTKPSYIIVGVHAHGRPRRRGGYRPTENTEASCFCTCSGGGQGGGAFLAHNKPERQHKRANDHKRARASVFSAAVSCWVGGWGHLTHTHPMPRCVSARAHSFARLLRSAYVLIVIGPSTVLHTTSWSLCLPSNSISKGMFTLATTSGERNAARLSCQVVSLGPCLAISPAFTGHPPVCSILQCMSHKQWPLLHLPLHLGCVCPCAFKSQLQQLRSELGDSGVV